MASLGGRGRADHPGDTIHPKESLINIFAAEFIRTLEKRSGGKAETVGVVTVVRKTMTKRSSLFEVKQGDIALGDTKLSDATEHFRVIVSHTLAIN